MYRLRWLSSLVVSYNSLSITEFFVFTVNDNKKDGVKKKNRKQITTENEVGRTFPPDFAPRVSVIQVFR